MIAALVLAGLGGYAFVHFSGTRSGAVPAVSRMPEAATPEATTQSFRCDGRTTCSSMASCDEAKFFLKNCPGTQMDGEGIPCERQWCTGPLGR